jgi:hypothetical protein
MQCIAGQTSIWTVWLAICLSGAVGAPVVSVLCDQARFCCKLICRRRIPQHIFSTEVVRLLALLPEMWLELLPDQMVSQCTPKGQCVFEMQFLPLLLGLAWFDANLLSDPSWKTTELLPSHRGVRKWYELGIYWPLSWNYVLCSPHTDARCHPFSWLGLLLRKTNWCFSE